MKPFLDVLGLISASLLVRSRYRKMPILASLNAKNRSKSPFSIGLVFSIVSDFTFSKITHTHILSVVASMDLLEYRIF